MKKDTAEPVVQAVHNAIVHTLADPSVRASLDTANLPASKPVSLAESQKAYQQSIEQYRGIARAIGLQPQ